MACDADAIAGHSSS